MDVVHEPSAALRGTAVKIVERLADDHDIDGVLLFGSVARGDATVDSDIDLLVVGRDTGQTVAALRRQVGSVDRDHRAGYVFHTRESFTALVAKGSRFLVHLRAEGDVLLDRTGQLREFLAAPWEAVSVDEEIAVELDRLENYDRPEIFGGRLLFPLAHIFTIGKAIVMARLTDDGVLEFNRRRAFEEYERRHPSLAVEVRRIADLEPFLARTRRQQVALPFSPNGPIAACRVREGVEAVRRVATGRR